MPASSNGIATFQVAEWIRTVRQVPQNIMYRSPSAVIPRQDGIMVVPGADMCDFTQVLSVPSHGLFISACHGGTEGMIGANRQC
jgi:hypothetical protein